MAVGAVPDIGSPGDPSRLNEAEMTALRWATNVEKYSRRKASTITSTQTPAVPATEIQQGGAGGADVNVIRYGQRDTQTGDFTALTKTFCTGRLPVVHPQRLPSNANILSRNPPHCSAWDIWTFWMTRSFWPTQIPATKMGMILAGRNLRQWPNRSLWMESQCPNAE